MIDTGQERLRSALRKLSGIEFRVQLSLSEDYGAINEFIAAIERPTSFNIRAADAFLQRFEQLFEVTLRRLFPAVIRIVDIGDRADGLLNTLIRLEKLGYITDAAAWVRRKELRDRLVHEYPDDLAERALDLTAALIEAAEMLAELAGVRMKLARFAEAGATGDDRI